MSATDQVLPPGFSGNGPGSAAGADAPKVAQH